MSKTRDNSFDPRKITRFRCKKGWSRTQLAARVGLSESAITLIEQGKRQNPVSIKKIARVLQVSMQELMTAEKTA